MSRCGRTPLLGCCSIVMRTYVCAGSEPARRSCATHSKNIYSSSSRDAPTLKQRKALILMRGACLFWKYGKSAVNVIGILLISLKGTHENCRAADHCDTIFPFGEKFVEINDNFGVTEINAEDLIASLIIWTQFWTHNVVSIWISIA